MTESVWVSAHVFRHDDIDELLLTQIAPLMSELTTGGLIREFFYLRYWEGGLQVRLRMRTAAEHIGEVRRRVTDRLGAHMRANPSRHPMDPAAYERLAARLADIEDHPGYDRYLYPPDTIRFIPYPPEHVSFGNGASLTLVERHFCESTAVALDTLRLPPPRRASAAMVMTLASLLSLHPGSPPSGLPHTGTARGGLMADGFDRAEAEAAWARSRDELITMADRLQTADLSATPRVPALTWLRSVRVLRDRLTDLRREGAFSSAFPDPVTHALHRCLHLHLNRMGTSLPQEARLRYLATRTIRFVLSDPPCLPEIERRGDRLLPPLRE